MDNASPYVQASDGGALELDVFAYYSRELSTPSRSIAPRSHPKYRSSCDACGQAKTKCDRSRPACARCVSQGASCVYGLSRKAGKPPRKRLATSPAEHETTATKTIAISTTAVDIMPAFSDGSMTMNPSEFSSPFDPTFQTCFPFDDLGSLDTITLNASYQSDSEPKPIESTPVTTPSSEALRNSCTRESKDIMRLLYCANPSNIVSDGVPAHTLDLGSVLTRSREVVKRLEILFKCPCARSPHMVMLYASILSRVLLWYQQAAGNGDPAGSSIPPLQTAQEPMEILKAFGTNSADGNSGSGVSVLPTPVTIGTFQSNDRNLQTALADCHLLSELKKVGALIDLFTTIGKDPSSIQAVGDACPIGEDLRSSDGDANLFASLGAWLRTEHGRIVTKARKGLSVLLWP